MHYKLVTRRDAKREWDVHFSIHEDVIERLGEYEAVRLVSGQFLVTMKLDDTKPLRLYKIIGGEWKRIQLRVPGGPVVAGSSPGLLPEIPLPLWP